MTLLPNGSFDSTIYLSSAWEVEQELDMEPVRASHTYNAGQIQDDD